MQCCERCFADRWIKRYFREKSTEDGDCRFCNSRNVRLLRVAELGYLFEPLMALYHELTPDTVADYESGFEIGESLLTLVQDDWTVFSARVLADGRAG
jgi:hypothetical protein